MKKLIFIILFPFLVFTQSNWERMVTPGTAAVSNLFKITDSVFICESYNGSIFKSNNEGKTWDASLLLNNTVLNSGYRDIILTPQNDVLLSTYGFDVISQSGIYRSTDKGQTWLRRGGGGERMAVNSSGFILASDNKQVDFEMTKSIDSGRSWSYVYHPWYNAVKPVYKIIPKGNDFLVFFRDSVLISADSGNSWNRYGGILPDQFNDVLFVDNKYYGAGTKGIFYSSDYGNSWINQTSGISSELYFNRLYKENNRIYGCSNRGLYYSDNFGVSWLHYNNSLINRPLTSACITSNVIIGSSTKAIVNIKPGYWSNSSDNFNILPKSLSLNKNAFFYNTDNEFYKSTDRGNSWIFNEEFQNIRLLTSQDSLCLLNSYDNFLYVSKNNGNTWQYVNSASYGGIEMALSKKIKGNFFLSIGGQKPNYPPQSTLFYYSSNGLVVTNIGNGGWYYNFCLLPGDTLFANRLEMTSFANLGIHRYTGYTMAAYGNGLPEKSNSCISADMQNDVYTASASGIYKLNKLLNLWYRIDSVTASNIFFNRYNQMVIIRNNKLYVKDVSNKIYDITPDGNSTVRSFHTDSLGYYYTLFDNGKIYRTKIASLIANVSSAPVLISPAELIYLPDSIKFLWNSSGSIPIKYSVSVSTDSTFIDAQIYEVYDTVFYIKTLQPNKLYYWRVKTFNEFGWSNNSSWLKFSTGISSAFENKAIEYSYELSQNYPNPFNPSTIIKYSVGGLKGKAHNVSLIVFDILGKESAVLVNAIKEAGSYEVTLETSKYNLSSGVYFYRLIIDDFKGVKKLLILK